VKPKPVFKPILGHGFTGFAAETLPRPLIYWFAWEDESWKITRKVLCIRSSIVLKIYLTT